MYSNGGVHHRLLSFQCAPDRGADQAASALAPVMLLPRLHAPGLAVNLPLLEALPTPERFVLRPPGLGWLQGA